jgi:hypothetical protein
MGEELDTTRVEVLKMKDREAVWTSSRRVVGGFDVKNHHVGCERGEVPIEGMFSPDSMYEAAGPQPAGFGSEEQSK